MTLKQDAVRIIRMAEAQGWTFEYSKGGHIFGNAPSGGRVTIPSTPSTYRGFANMIGQMRREGLAVPHRQSKPKRDGLDNKIVAFYQTVLPQLELDANLEEWPHISAILGRWRNESWFREDGTPIGVAEWDAIPHEGIVGAVMLAHLDGEYKNEGGVFAVHVDAKKKANLPRGRRLRTYCDAFKFWQAMPHEVMDNRDSPRQCSCGTTFTDPGFGVAALASHIVHEHERGHVDHEPVCDYLRPWEDPEELELLMSDPLSEEVERLKQALDISYEEKAIVQRELSQLKEKLKGLLS